MGGKSIILDKQMEILTVIIMLAPAFTDLSCLIPTSYTSLPVSIPSPSALSLAQSLDMVANRLTCLTIESPKATTLFQFFIVFLTLVALQRLGMDKDTVSIYFAFAE